MADDFAPWRSLDAELSSMTDHFANLVKASRIPEDTTENLGGSKEKHVPGKLLLLDGTCPSGTFLSITRTAYAMITAPSWTRLATLLHPRPAGFDMKLCA